MGARETTVQSPGEEGKPLQYSTKDWMKELEGWMLTQSPKPLVAQRAGGIILGFYSIVYIYILYIYIFIYLFIM